MNKHNTSNDDCPQNVLQLSDHPCTCPPAQKEEQKGWKCGDCGEYVDEGDMVFGKHVCPAQKEEWRNERNLQMVGVISLFQSKVYDTEKLYKEMEEIFKQDCISQISQAEARVRKEDQILIDTILDLKKKDVAEAEARGREDTINAFTDWAERNLNAPTEQDAFFAFADSLKKK